MKTQVIDTLSKKAYRKDHKNFRKQRKNPIKKNWQAL